MKIIRMMPDIVIYKLNTSEMKKLSLMCLCKQSKFDGVVYVAGDIRNCRFCRYLSKKILSISASNKGNEYYLSEKAYKEALSVRFLQ